MKRKLLLWIPLLVLTMISLARAQEGNGDEDLLGMYEIVVGIFLPLVISLFIREQWTKERKLWVSLLFVVLASAGYILYTGQFDMSNIGATILKIFFISVTTYKLFWLPSGVTNGLEMGVGLTNKE